MKQKLEAGTSMPVITLAKVGGGGVTLGGAGRWQLAIVYRGKHCPICRRYLQILGAVLDDFRALEAEVVAVSADTRDKAETESAEEGWAFDVGYGLTPDQMRLLGLYVSEPRSAQETDRLFSEPGLFITNPDGQVQVIDISNAPSARPDLQLVLAGLKFSIEKNLPVRGTA